MILADDRRVGKHADDTRQDSPGAGISILDLFSGAGGLTLGFHQASSRFQLVGAVESNPAAAATYERNFGLGSTYVGPIERWVDEEWVPGAHVVIGGPPCQGFSPLGRRRTDDQRNRLWRYYVQAVKESGALFFVMENVPQFLDSPEYALIQDEVRGGGLLADYDFRATVLNAADFGTAQSRKRAIVIGHRRDLRFPGWPEPTHPGQERWLTLRQAWAGIDSKVRAATPAPRRSGQDSSRTRGPYRSDELHLTRRYEDIMLQRMSLVPPGGSRVDLPEEFQMECWKHHTRGAMDVMGRLSWDKPSVTLRTGFTKPEKGRFLHPDEDRAITIHEGARIQGFPDDFEFMGSPTEITRQIGNAVPVPLARALGRLVVSKFA